MGGDLLTCKSCGKVMNIVNFMINPVCLDCAKRKHKEALGETGSTQTKQAGRVHRTGSNQGTT